MQRELVSFDIDLFDFEEELEKVAKIFGSEPDGLTDAGWTFRMAPVDPGIAPPGNPFPPNEIVPDHLNRCRDDRGGTNG